jgi:predicted GNAT superfamily acetyltransferase
MTVRTDSEAAALSIRPLSVQAEYEQAVSLQDQIWGEHTRDTVPACVLQISQEVGGVAVGAFAADGQLAGFVFGITGLRNGRPAHWSHILAVATQWRDKGLGRILKRRQREMLLGIGVEMMYWTFDPLESRNAHLNLNVVGARVERYAPHFYGETAVAATDTVIGTDRFVVSWNMTDAETLHEICDMDLSRIPPVTPDEVSASSSTDLMQVVGDSHAVRIKAPADIQSLKTKEPEAAVRWRRLTRHAFLHYLDAGYLVSQFVVEPGGRGGWYILTRKTQVRTDAPQ